MDGTAVLFVHVPGLAEEQDKWENADLEQENLKL